MIHLTLTILKVYYYNDVKVKRRQTPYGLFRASHFHVSAPVGAKRMSPGHPALWHLYIKEKQEDTK